VAAQRGLELPVRMGLATGEAELREADYFGLAPPELRPASRWQRTRCPLRLPPRTQRDRHHMALSGRPRSGADGRERQQGARDAADSGCTSFSSNEASTFAVAGC
jgi:hypothetical protein